MSEEIISALIGGVSGAVIAQFTSIFDKSKIFFEKKFQALSEIHNLVQEMHPKWPLQMDMEWHEALTHLAHKAGDIEKQFSGFRKKFSAALTDTELKSLDRAIELARETNFSVAKDDPQPEDFTLSKSSTDIADKMWTEITNLENEIRLNVLNQTRLLPSFFKCWKAFKSWKFWVR